MTIFDDFESRTFRLIYTFYTIHVNAYVYKIETPPQFIKSSRRIYLITKKARRAAMNLFFPINVFVGYLAGHTPVGCRECSRNTRSDLVVCTKKTGVTILYRNLYRYIHETRVTRHDMLHSPSKQRSRHWLGRYLVGPAPYSRFADESHHHENI
jgi:hypothetical protein